MKKKVVLFLKLFFTTGLSFAVVYLLIQLSILNVKHGIDFSLFKITLYSALILTLFLTFSHYKKIVKYVDEEGHRFPHYSKLFVLNVPYHLIFDKSCEILTKFGAKLKKQDKTSGKILAKTLNNIISIQLIQIENRTVAQISSTPKLGAWNDHGEGYKQVGQIKEELLGLDSGKKYI
jgi:hypothetical protein